MELTPFLQPFLPILHNELLQFAQFVISEIVVAR
jgi:hypothetical protein